MKNRIRELRKACGWGQNELGTLLNVTNPTVSKYETGNVLLSDITLCHLADIFDVSIDYILMRSDVATLPVTEESIKKPVAVSSRDRELIRLLHTIKTIKNQKKAIRIMKRLLKHCAQPTP